MPADEDRPATLHDLAAAEQRIVGRLTNDIAVFRQQTVDQITSDIAAARQQTVDQLTETMRDMQSEILRGLEDSRHSPEAIWSACTPSKAARPT
jgi:hypothetical protein